jgi:hypothetical protein
MPKPCKALPILLAPRVRRELMSADGCWQVCIVGTPSGTVMGRSMRVNGSAQNDTWSMYQSAAQVASSAASDPLKFLDPLMFRTLHKELDHAIEQRTQPHGNRQPGPGPRPGPKVCPGPSDDRTGGN